MKNRVPAQGLSRAAKCAANLPIDTLVKITGNETVALADAGATVIGRTITPVVDGDVTVETRYRELSDLKFAAALVAGTFFKLGAPDGVTGENTAVAWVAGTDAEAAKCGIVWVGAAAGANGTVMMF